MFRGQVTHMQMRERVAIIAALIMGAGMTGGVLHAQQAEVGLVLSSDDRRSGCGTCPWSQTVELLSRRVVVLRRLRERRRVSLLLDGGGALFGGGTREQGAKVIKLFNHMGYTAINLSPVDFRLGKQATLALVKQAKFRVLSANLLDAASGKRLVQPYLLRGKTAIVGLSQRPAGLAHLAHLREQLAGVRIGSPDTALKALLPELRQQGAKRVLVLYHGSAAGAIALRRRWGGKLDAILVGGARRDYLPMDGRPPLIAAGRYGAGLTVASLAWNEKSKKNRVRVVYDSPPKKP